MRLFLAIWLLALATRATAAPDPAPPEGFAAPQYIDASGCVFQRDGRGWKPRLDRQGARICGFPPTLSAQDVQPDSAEPQLSIEEQLLSRIKGETGNDTLREPAALPVPENALQRGIRVAISRREALQAAISGARPGDELCRLLGYEPDETEGPALGVDVTRGLCPGMRPVLPHPRIIVGGRLQALAPAVPSQPERPSAPAAPSQQASGRATEVTSQGAADPARPEAMRPRSPRPATPPAEATPPAANRPATTRPASTAEARPSAPSEPARIRADMIPAGARYIQIGGYRDEASARRIARMLMSQGYPVGLAHSRGEDGPRRIVVVGPFADRQSLVRAMNDLTAQQLGRTRAR